jgi:uncharacterized membrane protein
VGQFDRDLTCSCIGSTCHKFLWWCPNFKVRVFFYSFFRRYTVRSILFRIFLTQGRPKNQTAQTLVLGPPKYFLFYKGIRSQKNSLNYIYIYLGLILIWMGTTNGPMMVHDEIQMSTFGLIFAPQ